MLVGSIRQECIRLPEIRPRFYEFFSCRYADSCYHVTWPIRKLMTRTLLRETATL